MSTIDSGPPGRNALYLSQQGFNVTAVDSNANAIRMLQSIVAQEGISSIDPRVYPQKL